MVTTKTQKGVIVLLFLIYGCNKDDFARAQSTNQTSGNLLQYRPGDILIAGLMRVHRRGNELCSEIQEDGVQAVETMNMIIDQVNYNDDVLQGIKLGTIMIDTCDVDSHALRRVVVDILPLIWNVSMQSSGSSGPRPIIPTALIAGVVGSASSAVSIQVANLLQVFEIPQVSYWSTSPDLSDKLRYKYFFRVVPSDTNQADAMIGFVEGQNWNYISVVYEDDVYGVRGYTVIKELAEMRNICIASSEPIPRNPTSADFTRIVTHILEQKAEAVILFSKRNDASELLLAAQKLGDAASHFIWIGSDGWARQLPMGNSGLLDSTLDGAVGFTPKTENIRDLDEYITNLTNKDGSEGFRNPWFGEYIGMRNNCTLKKGDKRGLRRCGESESVDPGTFKHLAKMESVADSVLAFVNALDQYHREHCDNKPGLCPRMKKLIGTNRLATGLHPYLKGISFEGINGRTVKFDEYQDGPAQYNILNFDARSDVGYTSSIQKWTHSGVFENGSITWYDALSDKVTNASSVCSQPCGPGKAKKVETEMCCWICQVCRKSEYVSQDGTACVPCPLGYVPNWEKTACSRLPITELSYRSVYGIACICLGSIGIVGTILVTVIYISYRDTAIVKASGKELCFFVLFGIFITFMNFFAMTSHPTVSSCVLSRIILTIGPTIMYAGLLTKTIRVVIIFQSKAVLSVKVRKFVRPGPQILWATTLVLVQVIAVTAWFVVEKPKVQIFYPAEGVAFRACAQMVDLPLLYGLVYPFILIIICTVLATINRDVPTGFNETQFIGFSMYTTCVIWLAFLPIFITNPSDLAQRIMTTSVCLTLSATTILVCLFGPRCYTILFHPEENTQKAVISRMDKGGTPASIAVTMETTRKTSVLDANSNSNNNNNNNRKSFLIGKRWRNRLRRAMRMDRTPVNNLRNHDNQSFDFTVEEIPYAHAQPRTDVGDSGISIVL